MVSVSMPWEIVRLPFRESERAYKRYVNGATVVATTEEIRVWEYVQALRAALEQARPGEAQALVPPPTAKLPAKSRPR